MPRAVLTVSAFAMVGPILTRWSRTSCGAWARRSGRCTSSSSGPPAGRCSPRCCPTPTAPDGVIVLYRAVDVWSGLLILRSSTFIQDDLALIVARDPRGAGRARAAAWPTPIGAGAPGEPRRLLLRPGADPLRRRLRGAQGRGARPARHERRRQVDDPAGHRRAGHPVARRGSPQRPLDHVRLRRSSGPGSGIHMLPGGKGVFDDLSDPREPRGRRRTSYRKRPRRRRRGGSTRALEAVPGAGRATPTPPAGRCRAVSSRCWRSPGAHLHEPEILIIDELSLGLAPIVVERLVEVIGRSEGEGMTIIIVEQSLNVAAGHRRPGGVPREGPRPLRGADRRPRRTRRPGPGRVPRRGGRLMLAAWCHPQVVFNGLVQGLVYGLLAMAIVLVYRSTQGHQLRRRQHGPRRRRPAGDAQRQLRRAATGSRSPSPSSSASLYGGDRSTRRGAPALHRAPGDPARGDHRRRPAARWRS